MPHPGRVQAASVVITGIPELDRQFKFIGIKVARKACRSALGRGMTVVAKQIRRNVPKARTKGHTNQELKQSVRGRQVRGRASGIAQAKVGIGVGRPKGSNHLQVPLIALGTTDRKRKRVRGIFRSRSGTLKTRRVSGSTGRMTGNDFVGRAYQTAGNAAVQMMITTAAQVIQKESAK